MEKNATCPCGSAKAYTLCCGPYLEGSAKAPTAEALMRSRYTAYVQHAIDYIVDTCVDGVEGRIDREETRKWSENSHWEGLKILEVQKGGLNDTEGLVEFEAVYTQKGIRYEHHERSSFVKKDGVWLFEDGAVIPKTIQRTGEKVGRNDPCPCGSGKKYKKCCGA